MVSMKDQTYMVDLLVCQTAVVLEDVVIVGTDGLGHLLDDWLIQCVSKDNKQGYARR